jgi:choline kinase
MSSDNKIKAVILAAGEGTRLRPYTLDRPKCLVEVDGSSLLDRQLAVLATKLIEPIILIGGYRIDQIDHAGITILANPRYADTNMVWTLFCAEHELEGDILICYGDIVYSKEVLQAVLNSKSDIAVAIDLDWEVYWRQRNEDPLADAETLKLSDDNQILEIGQKPKSLAEIEGQYLGLIKFTSEGIKQLKKTFHDAKSVGVLRGKVIEKAYMTDLLQAMVDSGIRLDAVPIHGQWVEVDTVSDLLSAVTKERLLRIQASL